jgi:hypothetical protein
MSEHSFRRLLAKCQLAEIRNATGLSYRYSILIRRGHAPHPRHYAALTELVLRLNQKVHNTHCGSSAIPPLARQMIAAA